MADDSNPAAPPPSPADAIASRLQVLAATLASKHGSDLNQTAPVAEYDPATGQRFFDTAPVPLKRLLSSPLAQSGKFATGPGSPPERVITAGWESTPLFGLRGLDYTATVGESVLAAADGVVTFVGFWRKTSAPVQTQVTANKVKADVSAKTILDDGGNVVASSADQSIGFGGISVTIAHDADFEGYSTDYFHLNSTSVSVGDRVTEGSVIGTAGVTGGPTGFVDASSCHLHFQTSLVGQGLSALVRPTRMVPNYWAGHADSTTITTVLGVAGPPVLQLLTAAVGTQIVSSSALAQIQASDRAVLTQNQGVTETKQNQATYSDLLKGRMDVLQSALYKTVAAFTASGIVVADPMTFNFSDGTWNDGNPL